MTDAWRSDYELFTEACPGLPIFFEPWFLDVLAPGWQAVVLKESERPVGVWTWYPRRKGPFRTAAMPLLMRFMGPYLLPGLGQEHLLRLWEALPRFAMMEQHLHYAVTDAAQLTQFGCRLEERYSYRLDLRLGRDTIWQGVRAEYRNRKIPRAAEELVVEESEDVDAFLKVNRATFARQGLKAPVPEEDVRLLFSTLRTHGRGTLLLARERRTGDVLSGALLVWDRDSIYHLMAGDDPRGRAHHAGIFLTWACIEYGLEKGWPTFDFLGSMIPSIEAVRRQFGANPTPYFGIRYFRRPILERLATLWERVKT